MAAKKEIRIKLGLQHAKEHYLCYRCGGVIKPKEQYYRLYVTGKDGENKTAKSIKLHNRAGFRPRLFARFN